eukprot:scaffold1447_cov115-Isochrysis_galbana.AAC.5
MYAPSEVGWVASAGSRPVCLGGAVFGHDLGDLGQHLGTVRQHAPRYAKNPASTQRGAMAGWGRALAGADARSM